MSVESNRPQSLRSALGIDAHILGTLLFRGWTVLAGGATVLLLPIWLSPVEQGYYYTIASLLALQVFFELGLNQVLVQIVSHEVAHLIWLEDNSLKGPPQYLDRLSTLTRLIKHWYAAAALLFAAIAGCAGGWFFFDRGTLPPARWLYIWAIVISATSVNLWYSPALATLEGCGRVGQVARLRLLQSLVGYCALWGLLLFNGRLWIAAAVPVANAICTGYWLRRYGGTLRWLAQRETSTDATINWHRDVFPMQWRIAVSWISGYFIFHFFTPLVFSRYGAVEAGKLGMAMTLFSALSTVGMSWVNAKAPSFSMHIARGERKELDSLFRSVAKRSIIFIAATSAAAVAVAVMLVHFYGMPLLSRIAEPPVLAGLALVTTANAFIFAAAAYMRAHREEPMLPVSVTTGVLTAISAHIGSMFGITPMIWAYAAVTIFIALPWTGKLLTRYQARSIGP